MFSYRRGRGSDAESWLRGEEQSGVPLPLSHWLLMGNGHSTPALTWRHRKETETRFPALEGPYTAQISQGVITEVTQKDNVKSHKKHKGPMSPVNI